VSGAGGFATWGSAASASALAGKPTQGFDYVTYTRMPVFCVDSGAADWERGAQQALLARFAPLSQAFGWWTREDADIVGLSTRGIVFRGGGHNLGLYDTLPPLPPGTPQPTPAGPLPAVPATAALAVFSFTQGDAASFDQKFNIANLRAPSATEPGRRIAERHAFSLMASPLDATSQPSVVLQARALSTKQWLLGKPYGYASATALRAAGLLGAYVRNGTAAMSRCGYKDTIVNEAPSAALNSTVREVARLAGAAGAPFRSVLVKHPLAFPWTPGARHPGQGGRSSRPGAAPGALTF